MKGGFYVLVAARRIYMRLGLEAGSVTFDAALELAPQVIAQDKLDCSVWRLATLTVQFPAVDKNLDLHRMNHSHEWN